MSKTLYVANMYVRRHVKKTDYFLLVHKSMIHKQCWASYFKK